MEYTPVRMKRLSVLILAVVLSGCTIPFIGGKKAGIKITTSPPATAVLSGKQLGQTPIDATDLKTGTFKLQLIPQSGSSWESTVTLRENTQTVVERIFGATDQGSEGYTMELEPINDKTKAQLTIVTIPDLATIKVDGQPKGFAPINATAIAEGGHELTVTSAGYNDKRLSLSVPKGYHLVLTVQLARAKVLEPIPTPTPEEAAGGTPTPTPKSPLSPTPGPAPDRPYVEILTTPTGWLRVRSEPDAGKDNEITKVNPGATYKFLQSNDTGWYQIELPDGQKGWISGQYAKLFR